MGKVVAGTQKDQIKEAAGPLQTDASHGAGQTQSSTACARSLSWRRQTGYSS